MKQISFGKHIMFILLIFLSIIYSLPNFYEKVPSIIIIPKEGSSLLNKEYLNDLNIKSYDVYKNNNIYLSFNSLEEQMDAYNKIISEINIDKYYVNLNLLSSAPDWLKNINSKGASLGLDLMGGVHFLMNVDISDIKKEALNSYQKDLYSNFENIEKIELLNDKILIKPYNENISTYIKDNLFHILTVHKNNDNSAILELNDNYLKGLVDTAVKQNIFTLKNRVNELGVAEPIIQRDGFSSIIIQLPGIQDTQKAKDLIGTTATLSFQPVKKNNTADSNTESIKDLSGVEYIFEKNIIVDGKSIIDASSGIDPQSQMPLVSVGLDHLGGEKMYSYTSKNKGNLMGSILTETSYKTIKDDDGNDIKIKSVEKKAINVARINGVFSNRFQVTGLDDKNEAHNLAILLRSGSLATPVEIIEERTIGPNMGAENIKNGKISVLVGFLLVLILMTFKYRTLGLVANFCVVINLMLLLSLLSMVGATLTLPGIAGILLTVGMSVDGNVVIFERIKEEFDKSKNLYESIKNGYEKAFSTIIDANVTTFIAAIVLFSLGSGPIKGFAITLSIGIFTSVITSYYLSKYIVSVLYTFYPKLILKEKNND